jgi:hypothetical protein
MLTCYRTCRFWYSAQDAGLIAEISFTTGMAGIQSKRDETGTGRNGKERSRNGKSEPIVEPTSFS